MKKTVILFLMLAGLAASVAAQQPTPLRCSTPCDNGGIPSDPQDTEKIAEIMMTMNSMATYQGIREIVTDYENEFDYVSGLVAKALLKAWTETGNTDYYDTVKDFADANISGSGSSATVSAGNNNIDDIAVGKIFFELYKEETRLGNTSDATKYKAAADYLHNKLVNSHARIDTALSDGDGLDTTTGGFWHKNPYVNQMWLDGLFMGTAFYAEWQANFGADDAAAWTDIVNQFRIIHKKTFDTTKELNYHAWSAQPGHDNSFWTGFAQHTYTGASAEFWGRGMGWYFAALVDVLGFMQDAGRTGTQDYLDLRVIVNQVAAGLARWQDQNSGCWYQLLQYNNTMRGNQQHNIANINDVADCDNYNYLESSASSMFTYAFFKGINIGVLDNGNLAASKYPLKTYAEVAEKAYEGVIDTFITGDGSTIAINNSCRTAGLGDSGGGNKKGRTGTINYYLCGTEDGVRNKVSNEGKAIGPFIMANLEYEVYLQNK